MRQRNSNHQRTLMANAPPSDEQALYSAFQQLADVLLPLKQELRVRAHAMVGAFLGVTPNIGSPEAGTTRPAGHRSPPPTRIAGREPPPPKDFLFQKQPTTDVERVACLAFYLTNYRDIKRFKATDISKLNTEAGQRKFANASSTVNNAMQRGFLAPVSNGLKQLAPEGERYVDELPDHQAAKAAFGTRKARRERRQGRAAKASANIQVS